jgi:hypothetical protein
VSGTSHSTGKSGDKQGLWSFLCLYVAEQYFKVP